MRAKPTVANVALTSGGTEYSYAFPDGTKGFEIKARALNALLRIAFVSGGTDTTYATINYGDIFKMEGAKMTGVTVYLQSNQDSDVAEITSWK